MDRYITIEEFKEKVARRELYSGYVIRAGYAYISPIILQPQKYVGSVLLDGEFIVIWVQKLNNSPEMQMKSIKEDPAKWTDFWGSTKLQRFAAEEYAKGCNGVIKKVNSSNIYVEYIEKIFDKHIIRKQYFHDDGSLTSQYGEIKQLERRSFKYFEMWIDSQSDSALDSIQKFVCALGYSTPNSVSILLRGRTIAGSPVNSNDKVAALIDVGPGLILWALKATGVVTKVGKGLQGYNQYLQRKPYLKGNSGLPQGTTWQQHAGRSFQTNKEALIMNKQANEFLDNIGYGNTIYERYQKNR